MHYFLFLVLILNGFGASLKENIQNSLATVDDKGKVKVKLNYNENPNPKDYFIIHEPGNFIALGPLKDLNYQWHGNYDLNKDSIVWINPSLKPLNIFNLIHFGTYNIYLKFNNVSNSVTNKLSGIEITQDEVTYDSVNIEIFNDKQINYWTKALSKDWLEVVRGKIFRINDNEMFITFQTTVYEKKTPIYAFNGKSVLKKAMGGR